MSFHRISVDIDEEDHKYLKMCCLKLGTSIKAFVVGTVLEKVEEYESEWMLNEKEEDFGANFVLIDHSGKVHAIPS